MEIHSIKKFSVYSTASARNWRQKKTTINKNDLVAADPQHNQPRRVRCSRPEVVFDTMFAQFPGMMNG